jgi:hypothetical protein
MERFQKTSKKVLDKIAQNKVVASTGATLLGAVSSQAAVTVDPATGVLSGSIDTAMYSSGIPIVIGFIAFTLGVGAVIALLKRAR